MRRILAVTVLVLVFVWAPAAAQGTRPVRIAGHFTRILSDDAAPAAGWGAKILVPLAPRLDVYPSVSRFVADREWEVSIALQYRPFGSPDRTPFYLAAGWLGLNNGIRGNGWDLWALGVEIPSGRLRPFAELQVLGPLRHVANPNGGFGGVQAQFGMSWAAR